MKYYSTNKQAPMASLQEAVVKGLAADKGLFMPMTVKPLPQEFFFNEVPQQTCHETAAYIFESQCRSVEKFQRIDIVRYAYDCQTSSARVLRYD